MTLLSITEEQLKALIDDAVQHAVTSIVRAQQPDEMLSKKEVAALLSICTRSVDNYTQDGILKKYKMRGSARWKRTEVLESWRRINYGR